MTADFKRYSLRAALFVLCACATSVRAEPATHGTAELGRLDRLPAYRSGTTVASFSSYDRTGKNDDGFSGTYSSLRKEGDRLVIAEMKGPGAIYRIWTPTPTDDLMEFFFDGETEPRIAVKFRDVFSGTEYPFLRPVVGRGAGGFYSYVPLTYAHSCKVTVKAAKIQFYQINYTTFATDAGVQTFDPKQRDAAQADFDRATKLINAAGTDISAQVVSDGAAIETHPFADTLQPGKAITLFESETAGRIAAIKVAPASGLAELSRETLLNVYYDGDAKPSFSCPAGDFFGFSFGQPAMRSLLVGTAADTCYAYWPMPYAKSIRIELASDNPNGSAIAVHGEVKTVNQPRQADEGEFYAVWHREKPTTKGKPYSFVHTEGKGQLVGVALQAQGPEPGGMPEFFEGDDQTTIDGKLVINGTGSEDFFNGGWYDLPGQWEDRVTLPLSGCLDYKRYLGRTGGYRLLLTDAYPFEKSIDQTIEHGPADNQFVTDYTSVAYLYADRPPTATTQPIAPLAERAVENPRDVVFRPGTSMPVYSFSRDEATLSKHDEKVGDNGVRFLSLETTARSFGGGNQFIALGCDIPQAGKYSVSVEPLIGPQGATIQLFEYQYPVGEKQDLYAPALAAGKTFEMGTVAMQMGENRLTFRIVGKNPAAKGCRLDLVRVICTRID